MSAHTERGDEPADGVKETSVVLLEYDPLTRRKVLNTYEIYREIGRGEHGKVKLARDLVRDELVAIKIVNRKLRRDKLHMRALPHETKIRREIAILKRCRHKYVVKLREVLDDVALYKIYLVLEYMEKGEIKWKCPAPVKQRRLSVEEQAEIPCCDAADRRLNHTHDLLLNGMYLPNLTFRQLRRILRHVLLGLEYLHLQGVVHRDIKPANLLVGHDNVVKISDFGVLYAPTAPQPELEAELAKTVGTPAFFAPELCGAASRPTAKIDIWALGVTLYCLLFGRVPFNADSEFHLFEVIVKAEVEFPANGAFNSPAPVSDAEYAHATDLVRRLLDKDALRRISFAEMKHHPFVLMDLENDPDTLHELFFLNAQAPLVELDLLVGVGARVRPDRDSPSLGSSSDFLPHLLLLLEALSDVELPGVNEEVAKSRFSLTRLDSGSKSVLHRSLCERALPFSLRKGSVGPAEAPQIETKRNVGGDLYLTNQLALDTFKGIQEMDQKRRKLSALARLADPVVRPVLVPGDDKGGKIKVGPISIDASRRRLLVMSLPLTESLALLDLLNDEYLYSKYQEFRSRKNGADISARFELFNLGSLMVLKRDPAADGVAPHDELLLDDDDNLTLKFTLKVEPKRPPFLSLSQRALSHDLSIPDLIKLGSCDAPVVFTDLEFEDVPDGLLEALPKKVDPRVRAVMAPAQLLPLRREVVPLPAETEREVALGYFNNHYHKEPISSPFPRALHLEETESFAKKLDKQEARPGHYRSNSITVGLLQHRRAVVEE